MSNHYVKQTTQGELEVADVASSTSIKIIAEIIANQNNKKLLQDEQFGITASADDSEICEKSKAA